MVGSRRAPALSKRLILADTGGSNSATRGAWKDQLLCDRLGLTVTVAHYPTGASKYNPIERRLFSQISRNWAAEPLTDYNKILSLIRGTTTTTGLKVRAYLDREEYPLKVNRPRNGYANCESRATQSSPSGTTPLSLPMGNNSCAVP